MIFRLAAISEYMMFDAANSELVPARFPGRMHYNFLNAMLPGE